MTVQTSAARTSPAARWAACAVPALAAAACVLYAVMPDSFPVDTGRWIALAAVAELPTLFLGAVHAVALKEGRRGERYFVFGIGLVVLVGAGGLHLAWHMAASDMAPIFGWLLLGMLVELYTNPADPQLAHDRAWALLNDRATLLGYLPNIVVGAALVGLALHLGFLASGSGGFEAFVAARLAALDSSDLAWLPAVYLGTISLCAAYAYGPAFLEDRRSLLAVLQSRWKPRWRRRDPQ